MNRGGLNIIEYKKSNFNLKDIFLKYDDIITYIGNVRGLQTSLSCLAGGENDCRAESESGRECIDCR